MQTSADGKLGWPGHAQKHSWMPPSELQEQRPSRDPFILPCLFHGAITFLGTSFISFASVAGLDVFSQTLPNQDLIDCSRLVIVRTLPFLTPQAQDTSNAFPR